MKSKKTVVAQSKPEPIAQHMNIKDIESLIKFVQNSGVSEVSLEQKDFKITIKTTHSTLAASPNVIHQAANVPAFAVTVPAGSAPPSAPAADSEESKYVIVKSPMIGTFYRTPSPEKPSFVNVGDDIKPGKVVCIIEAMKLFNEIEAEISGRIVKVFVDNATPVEYDQPLFLVDPS